MLANLNRQVDVYDYVVAFSLLAIHAMVMCSNILG